MTKRDDKTLLYFYLVLIMWISKLLEIMFIELYTAYSYITKVN